MLFPRVLEDEQITLPDDKVLVPGVIDVTNNYIEHPQLVTERLERFANVVGRERIIASTDSGFAAFSGDRMVDPKIAFKKLESLVRGAELATRRLWGVSNNHSAKGTSNALPYRLSRHWHHGRADDRQPDQGRL